MKNQVLKLVVRVGIGTAVLVSYVEVSDFFIKDSEKQKIEQSKKTVEDAFQSQKSTILWNGYGGKPFDIKLTSYGKNGNIFVTGEEVIKDIVWAKLELCPTVGSVPTLSYMDNKNIGRVNKIACSWAEIL